MFFSNFSALPMRTSCSRMRNGWTWPEVDMSGSWPSKHSSRSMFQAGLLDFNLWVLQTNEDTSVIRCKFFYVDATVSFNDLDQGSEMIILKSILTTFIPIIILRGCWGSSKNWLELTIEPPQTNLACLIRWNTLYFLEGAIQKIRDTLLALLRPPSPHMTFFSFL